MVPQGAGLGGGRGPEEPAQDRACPAGLPSHGRQRAVRAGAEGVWRCAHRALVRTRGPDAQTPRHPVLRGRREEGQPRAVPVPEAAACPLPLPGACRAIVTQLFLLTCCLPSFF